MGKLLPNYTSFTNPKIGKWFHALAASCLFLIASLLPSTNSYSQLANLRFTNAAATYTSITGGTSLVAAGTAVGAVSPVTNIGFTFKFQGIDYTQFSVNAAGLLKLGSVVVTNESVNSAITTTNTPKIYALWDAFYTGTAASGGGVTYKLTGAAPNRVLTVQWVVNSTSATTASGVNFQVLLYETSNKIEFLYGASPALPSASVGLGGLDGANDYLSVFTKNAIITAGVNFNTNTVIPGAGSGHKFTFTPTTALTATPACLADAPSFWVKADEGINYTRTLLNVPAANRTATSYYTQTPNFQAVNSTLTGANGWIPAFTTEGANSTPTGDMGSITLDLGSVQTIDGVATLGASNANYIVSDYTVKVSNDNVTFTNLGMFQGNEINTELHYADFDAPVTCRYVKVFPGAFTTYRAMRLDVYTKTATALPANNTKVSVWEDLSGNSWDASQPTTVANQPTFLTNQFNFNPALNFPAATNKLDIPDFNVAVRYLVTASAVGAVPTIASVTNSPIIQYGAMGGPQVIAENLAYRNTLTTAQENVVKSYLATKYGITLTQDYMAGDGTTKIYDLTANSGYTNNIFGIGRADCEGLHQRQSKSMNTDGLITIGNNNSIDFTNGNKSTSGNNIATNSSYLMIGDNGASLDLNTATLVDSKYFVNRTFKLQETGTIGSVKISVPAYGNTSATSTLPTLPSSSIVYVAIDNDGNFTNGGTTYVAMTAVGSGATLTYEANTDLTSASPYLRFAVAIPDTDGDTVNNLLDIDADNDGILNAIESPSCFYTADEISVFEAVSSQLAQYSTWVITNAIEPSSAGAAFTPSQNWVGKEIFHFTSPKYVAISGLTLNLTNWALSSSAANTFKLQGSADDLVWTDLSTAVASTANTGSFTVSNTLATASKFKYFRLIGVAGVSYYGGVSYASLNVATTYNPSAYPKTTCIGDDTDADGTSNYLDLDSDGDGCFDAIEAGVLTSSADGKLPTPWGANGFADAKETASESGLYNGYYSYDYALKNKYIVCADFDGDGIKDIVDLDDDNDGILDHFESPSCFVSSVAIVKPISVSSELSQYSTNLIGYSIDYDPATLSGFSTGQDWVGKEIFKFEAASYTLVTGVSLDMNSWAFATATTSTFKLQGSTDNYTWSDLSAPMSSQATTGTVTINNTLVTTTKFKYLRILGVAGVSSYVGVTDLRINIPTGFNSSAYPKETCTEDKDSDTKLNHQDLDSDGDGCFDGIEAGVLPISNTTGIAPGSAFGNNGFADAFETATESGTYKKTYYYDYAVNSAIINCTDTDGDGILNLIDIDDDNDGVLDADEASTCYVPFQEWNTASKSSNVSITSNLSTLSPNTNFALLTDNATTAAVQFVTATAQTQYNKELFRASF